MLTLKSAPQLKSGHERDRSVEDYRAAHLLSNHGLALTAKRIREVD